MIELTAQTISFYILAVIAVISALAVVTLKNLVHSVLFLALFFFCVAGFYVLLNAEFLAAVQVFVYVGGITVLFLFLIMLTFKVADKRLRQVNEQWAISFVIVVLFGWLLITGLSETNWAITAGGGPEKTVPAIGKLLLTTYVFPFEVVSVVLLAALIGAIVIASK